MAKILTEEERRTYNILIIDDSKAKNFKGIETTYVDELKKKIGEVKDMKFNVELIGGEYYTTLQAVKDAEKIKEKGFDYVIINLGVNDCSPRFLNESWSKRIKRLPQPVASFIRIRILRRFKKTFFFLFGSRLLLSEEDFKSNIIKIIDIFKDKKIILMNICPANQELENRLPGISYNILAFNRKLGEISKTREIILFDIFNLIQNLNPEKALIDGVHYKENTCEAIACELYKIILEVNYV